MVAQVLAALLYLGTTHSDLAHDPRVRAQWWEMLVDARFGFAETEEAMFVVQNGDGSLSFVRWASQQLVREAQWNAPLPAGVIAIAHTHPNRAPLPSMGDVRTALRLELPVYVITRSHIMKTQHGETVAVAKGDWRTG